MSSSKQVAAAGSENERLARELEEAALYGMEDGLFLNPTASSKYLGVFEEKGRFGVRLLWRNHTAEALQKSGLTHVAADSKGRIRGRWATVQEAAEVFAKHVKIAILKNH